MFHRLQFDTHPFTWKSSYASCANEADRNLVSGEAAAFGLSDGFVVPVKTLEERIVAVSFGGDRTSLDPGEASKLSFVANYAIGRFLQLHSFSNNPPVRLTPRERECLQWSSEGKTEADIAEILHVSTSTISKHIASARDRLRAISKTQAVAVAMKLNLL